jgi:hypothetical protein
MTVSDVFEDFSGGTTGCFSFFLFFSQELFKTKEQYRKKEFFPNATTNLSIECIKLKLFQNTV